MRPGQEKGIDPVAAWPVSPHTLGRPRNGDHLLLVPDFVTGLVVFAAGVVSTGPLCCYNSCKEDSYRAAHPSWMVQEEAPADIRKQWRLLVLK